jgi:hypothetical protein
MRGEFAGGTELSQAIGLAAQWWRFLVAGLCAYGLLPRTLAWCFGRYRVRRALRRAPLDHRSFQRLYDRLLPAVGWEGPAPGSVRGRAPGAGGATAAPDLATAPGAPAWLLAWGRLGQRREALAGVVAGRFGLELRQALAAGGADLGADRAAIEGLGEGSAERVVFVFEAGQQPTKEVLGFLRAARDRVGSGRPFVVLLVVEEEDGRFRDADPDEREGWRLAVADLQDPHLWVDALEVPA